MAREVIYQHTDAQGRTFTIYGDRDSLMREINGWATPDPTEWAESNSSEYGNRDCPTEQETFEDIAKALSWLDSDNNWKTQFERIDRKKNGTFAKNRVHSLMRASSQAWYDVDSYGWRTPELRIKTLDDLTAEMSIFTITESY